MAVRTEVKDLGGGGVVAEPGAGLQLDTRVLGPLPIVDAFCDRLGLPALLQEYLPAADARVKLAPATMIGVVVANLVLHRRPVYALGEWAAPFEAGLLGLGPGEAELLNDDRVGRELARLFDADRASLLTRLVLHAIDRFGIDCSQLHNDSTSIKLSGVYADGDGHPRGGKSTAKIARGHSKDFRPDLKQLVWILTVSADGAVPVAYRVADGNTEDTGTHIDTWNHLVALLGTTSFTYVADSKLATSENMRHIDSHHGRFVSVLPASRAEDAQFRDWIVDHEPEWTEAARRPGRRHDDPDHVWWTTPAPWPAAEGYRVVWVTSSAKISYDEAARRDRIARGIAALDELNTRLASPKTRMKTTVAAQAAAEDALARTGAARWISTTVEQRTSERYRQEKRGRPGPDTRYRKITRSHHRVAFSIDEARIAHDAASDGMFPLVTNDPDASDAEVLAVYKWQPNLEKRHAQLKGTQLVAPMFLHDPARVEGLLCCHFIAMLIQALIERQTRRAMADRGLRQLSLYPEDRGCTAPTTARVLEIFTGLAHHRLTDTDGQHLKTFQPELSPLQALVLDLLDIPANAYTR
jgi:transposase